MDELNAAIGLARCVADGGTDEALAAVQQDLFDLGADLAVPLPAGLEAGAAGDLSHGRPALRVAAEQVDRLTERATAAAAAQGDLTSFVLPGGSEAAARLHLARTVCRRAERAVWALHAAEPVNPRAAVYLNRLSDLLFVLARAANDGGANDVLWEPGRGGGREEAG